MSEMDIRPVAAPDRERWLQLFRGYADFYSTMIDEITEATVWGWIFDEHEAFWCDLAIDRAGRIVGFVHYQHMHRSLGGGMVCYLSDLFVDPRARGSGAARRLIDHVFVVAKDTGVANVRWLTQEHNYTGRRLYDTYAKKSDFILYSVPVR